MASGWAKDGAVQDQIDASIKDAIKQVRGNLSQGKSRSDCLECGEVIPKARRLAVQGVQFCIECQSEKDITANNQNAINRKGSKDSQLR